MSERERMFESVRLLAYKIAEDMFGYEGMISRDDFRQEALIAALKAVDRYDPSMGALSTYTHCSVHNRLCTVLREETRPSGYKTSKRRDVPPVNEVSIDEKSWVWFACDDGNVAAWAREYSAWQTAVDALNAISEDRDQYVIVRRYGLDGDGGATLKEVGEEIGLTRERVRQLEIRAMQQMRERVSA